MSFKGRICYLIFKALSLLTMQHIKSIDHTLMVIKVHFCYQFISKSTPNYKVPLCVLCFLTYKLSLQYFGTNALNVLAKCV